MFESTAVYTTSSVLTLLFEVVYLLAGIIVLALSGVAARGRRGLVATGGALILLGALSDAALFAYDLYTSSYGAPQFALYPLVHWASTFIFIGGLLVLVLAATRRPTVGAADVPAPTPSGPNPSPAR